MRLRNALKYGVCMTLIMVLSICAPVLGANHEQVTNEIKGTAVNLNTKALQQEEAQIQDAGGFEEFAEGAVKLVEKDVGVSTSVLADSFQTMRIIVKSKEPLSDNTALECVSGYDNIYIFQYETVKQAKEAYQRFKQMECVEFAEPDEVVSAQLGQTDDATVIKNQYYNSWGISQMKIDHFQQYLRNTVKKSEDVVVAVIDTGLNATVNSVFQGRILEGASFVNEEGGSSFLFDHVAYMDNNGHGTAVTGIIAEATPENVKILPVKALNAKGSGTELVVYLGINYALNYGVDIINMSCGVEGESYAYRDAMHNADLLGITVVAAAGNESQNVANISPACIDSVIAVSSFNSDLSFSSFSNFGEKIDFAAPGGAVQLINYKGGVYVDSGTSFAAPHISAAAALMLCARPDLTADDIFFLMKEYAVDIGVKGFDVQYGYGWINMEQLEQPLSAYKLLHIGDVDGDGEYTVLDALAILQEASGENSLTSRQLEEADVNRDGQVTVSDALIIMEFIIRKDVSTSFLQ